MFKKIYSLSLLVMVAGLFSLAACTPTTGNAGVALQNEQGMGTTLPSIENPDQTGTLEPGMGTTLSSVENPDPTGNLEPGMAEGTVVTGPGPEDSQPPAGAAFVYKDTKYKFSVTYPANFVFRKLSEEELKLLNPRPVAGFSFSKPKTTTSSVPDELADLGIFIFSPKGISTLSPWLTSNGLTSSSGSPQLFTTMYTSGQKVCASTLIFPQCRYFILGNGWVYQLIPATTAGNTMFKSFNLLGSTETGPGPQGSQPPSYSGQVYTNTTYQFSMTYPANFVVRKLSGDELKLLNPRPLAGFSFSKPKTITSFMPAEPADLEILIFNQKGISSVDHWLTSNGLTSNSGSPQLFNTIYVSGQKVCTSILIFRHCRYFIFGNGWVYQLTPTTTAGNTMFKSIKVLETPQVEPAPQGIQPPIQLP